MRPQVLNATHGGAEDECDVDDVAAYIAALEAEEQRNAVPPRPEP